MSTAARDSLEPATRAAIEAAGFLIESVELGAIEAAVNALRELTGGKP